MLIDDRKIARLMVFCISVAMVCGTTVWAQDAAAPSDIAQGGFFGDGPSLGGGFQDSAEAFTVSARLTLSPQTMADKNAAREGTIFVTADISPGWHIYSITQPPGGPIATTIEIPASGSNVYQLAGKFRTDAVPKKETAAAFGGTVVETHEGKVTWQAPLRIAAGATLSSIEIKGSLRAQPCTDNSCLPPKSYPFTARFSPSEPVALPQINTNGQAAATAAESQNIKPEESLAPPASVGATAFSPGELEVSANEELADESILVIIAMSFAGGFILNLMPCVLPVIGLKLLSFVEQSGQSHSRAFMLNFWYSLGLMSVFMVLATLAVAVGLGWGMLFQYSGFTITLTAIVFVMALSFFDVWEIPIPGFAGHGAASDWSQREGYGGAFAKGILTTFLATPCSAPLLAPALAWTTSREWWEVYTVFFFVGLGMAFPYLMVGAFPRLIRFLPKPGDWMITFKHIMGFVLLGTVVYLLSTLHHAHMVPAIALMFGLWGACWWIGRTPPTADSQTKIRHWLQAAIFTCIIIIVAYPGIDDFMPKSISFGGIYDVMNARLEQMVEKRLAQADSLQLKETTEDEIGWNPFTLPRFEKLTAPKRPVLVDFTADWCLTCKTLESTVLNTPAVRQALIENNIIAMQADWTHGDPEITEMLEKLGSKQVPVIAIYPADQSKPPIVLRGGYTSGSLLAAIEEAATDK